jgi:Methionyl-tRNA formyltransferase
MVADLTELEAQEDVPRVVFFGMECRFSSLVLATLLGSGIEVCAVVMPTSGSDLYVKGSPLSAAPADLFQLPAAHLSGGLLPMAPVGQMGVPTSLAQLARRRHIPVWYVHKLAAPVTLATLKAYQPDLICVGCFSSILPPTLLALPRLGCVNVHPSLLPALRGPQPIFWTLYEGHRLTGTTVHVMTPQLDRGAILAQESFVIPDGMRATVLDERCARLGGRLLVQVVFELIQGQAHPQAQDETQSSYRSYPQAEDYVVRVQEWAARRLYNFICGVADESSPVVLLLPTTDTPASERRIVVCDALAYDNKDWLLPEGIALRGAIRGEAENEWVVGCQQGWVRVRETQHV